MPLSVSGSAWPMGRSRRLRATALTPRQTAALGLSTPSSGEIPGRSGNGARELESGTTTRSSSSTPAKISSDVDPTRLRAQEGINEDDAIVPVAPSGSGVFIL